MNGGPDQDISGIEIEALDDMGRQEVGLAMQKSMRRTGIDPRAPRGHGRVLNRNSDIAIRQQIAPLPVTSFATLITADVTILPQRTFKLTRMILVDYTDFDKSLCTVDNLKVGADNQFINNGSLPFQAALFNAVGAGLTGTTAGPGRQITITINNRSSGTRLVGGCFFGPAVEKD